MINNKIDLPCATCCYCYVIVIGALKLECVNSKHSNQSVFATFDDSWNLDVIKQMDARSDVRRAVPENSCLCVMKAMAALD